VVVEGEKCVHALANIGIVATTSPGGAGKAAKADWSPLAGKRVYLWPDNDLPEAGRSSGGREHMRTVAKLLEALRPVAQLFWIEPDNLSLADKGDAVDFLAMCPTEAPGAGLRAVEQVLAQAMPMGPGAEVAAILEATIAGERECIPWPWPQLSRLAKALFPGTVTVVCGDSGSSKSLLMLETAMHWHREGRKVCIFELEDDRSFHLSRVLAQQAGNSRLMDDDWLRANPDEARQAYQEQAELLGSFGRCMSEAPERQVSLDALLGWLHERLAEGIEIAIIDPVTAAEATDKPWIADLRFLIAAKTLIRQAGARLILVTHPKKGRKTAIGLDELAGGAAYARFTHTVLWLQTYWPAKSMVVQTQFGPDSFEVNRVLYLCKTRWARGAGLQLAMHFDPNTLTFGETGVVIDQKGKGNAKAQTE